VPLSNTALEILKSRERSPGRELVFGAGKGPFSGWSKAKAGLDKGSAMSDWRIHDIRRTVVTGMAEFGVQPHIIEAVVNHLSGHKGGVAGIYNRATYAAEKCDAMEKWADHLHHVVAKEKRDTQDS
jgi:integrase